MCGLAGFLLEQPIESALAERRLQSMVATLRHRGPDDDGVFSDGRAGLGFARLAIIDLSSAGHQPMPSADGQVWLVFNGEIYNFEELRQELQAKGHVFRGRSDTEVILCGYLTWGEDVLERLRGMFAIAIWDKRSRQMLLARDRIGKKPLNYMLTDKGLIFGSEIKAILAWPDVPREPDLGALHQFLTYQYIPAPLSAFRGIRKLPAAHKLTIRLDEQGRLSSPQVERYWRLPAPRPRQRALNPRQVAEDLTSRLEEAVRIRMVSDVPLGAFLSGGIDSSAVVAMMARHASGRVKTFSIGFENPEYDETRYARMVAERYNTDHHELIVQPDAISILPKLVEHYNEPFADPSAIPTYYLSEMTRRHVTVALNGDGGDEAFMGYNRYLSMQTLSRFDHVPKWLRYLGQGFAQLPVRGNLSARSVRAAGVLRDSLSAPQHRYAFSISAFADQHKKQAYGAAMRDYLNHSALDLLQPYFDEAGDLVSGANWADIHVYLPDDLMVKVDIASMAHSLECRSPLLDHVFLEWALTLPQNLSIPYGTTKAIFKKAMEPFLPKEVLDRPKMGFGCPIDHWFRDELRDMAYDLLLSPQAASRGVVRKDAVQRLLDEHCSCVDAHHTRLWPLLMMELWYRMWIDRGPDTARLVNAATSVLTPSNREIPKLKSVLLRLDPKTMRGGDGHLYSYELPAHLPPGDSEAQPSRSQAQLFEDNLELGPRHVSHDRIRADGGGRFSHWQNRFYFSTSDNSSPISNRRTYQILIPASMFSPRDGALLELGGLPLQDMKPMERFALARELFRRVWRQAPLPDHGRSIEHDEDFARDFARLSSESDVTYERKYNLNQIFQLVRDVDGDVAECGVYRGSSAYFLARQIIEQKLSKRLCLFDSFEGLSTPGRLDGEYWHAGALTSSIQDVQRALAPLGPASLVEFYPGWIPDRFADVADRRFCFVHIDVDLHDPTFSSVSFFYPWMSAGGIILLDDYGFDSCPGVTAAVDQFMNGKPEPIINLASGGAFIMRKLDSGAPA